MATSLVCPVDGTRLVLVTAVNASGDPIERWECPADLWQGPFYSGEPSGDNEGIPELGRDKVLMLTGGTVTTGGATEATLLDVKRSLTDYETRLDYDVRIDGNPVYVGKNLNGASTAAATWTIQKMTYDVTSRLTRAQVLTGSWDGRAALPW